MCKKIPVKTISAENCRLNITVPPNFILLVLSLICQLIGNNLYSVHPSYIFICKIIMLALKNMHNKIVF